MAGDQWLKLDAYFMAKPFPRQLMERLGPPGVIAWLGFLAACKRNMTQGRITFAGETDARRQLFLDCAHTIELVDNEGQTWTLLHDFFDFTGRMKQTRRIPHGRSRDSRKTAYGQLQDVVCTHWEHWQNDVRRADARERQRRSRAKNGCDTSVTENESEREIENESAGVTAAASQGAAATPALNGNGDPAAAATGAERARAIRAALRAPR